MLDSQRTRSNLFGGVILVVFCFFYTLPLIAVSFLANLAALWVSHPFPVREEGKLTGVSFPGQVM